MDAIKRVEISEGLEEISEGIGRIMSGDLLKMTVCGVTADRLTDLWVRARRLQQTLTARDVVSGYRRDALEQVGRVSELLYDMGLDPDDQQLAILGQACELVQEKIKRCQRLANISARVEMLVGAEEVDA